MQVLEANELINKIVERVKLTGEDNFLKREIKDSTLINDIFKTYKSIFGKNWKETCQSCYFDCYAYLYGALKNDKELVLLANKLYEVRPGYVLTGFPKGGNDKDCNNKNLTNELAEWHLKNNPGVEKYFTKMPIDWKERCERAVEIVEDKPEDTKPPSGKVEVKGKTYKEIKAIARQLQKEGKISKDIVIDHTKQPILTDLINKCE